MMDKMDFPEQERVAVRVERRLESTYISDKAVFTS